MAIDDDDFEDQLGLPDFLRDLPGIPGRRWPWMLLGLIIGAIATVVATLAWTPAYVAQSSILVSSQQIPKELVKTTVEEDPFNQINGMVGEVLSRTKLMTLVEKYDLYPEKRNELPMEEIVADMRKLIAIEPAEQRLSPGARRVETSQLITVSFESPDPKTAAAVTNSLTALFLEASLRSRMKQAGDISQFLRRELDRSERELRVKETEIANYKQAHRGELPSELASSLSRLTRLQEQRQSLAIQIAESETRIATMAATDSDPESPRARLTAARARLDSELAVHTAEHPNVIALQRRVAALEIEAANSSSVGGSVAAVIEASRLTLARLTVELARVEEELVDLDERVAVTPKRQEELDALEQVAGVLRDRYLDFLRKVEEADIAEHLESAQYGAKISIMDRAEPPAEPKRSRMLIALAGLVATIGLAAGAGLVFEMLDPVMVDKDQAESLANVPVLGSVSRIN